MRHHQARERIQKTRVNNPIAVGKEIASFYTHRNTKPKVIREEHSRGESTGVALETETSWI
jgi:hypothetical protein